MNTRKRILFLLITLALVLIPYFVLQYYERYSPPSVETLKPADLSPFSPEIDTGIIDILRTRHEEYK